MGPANRHKRSHPKPARAADENEVLGILTSEDLIRLLAEDSDYMNEAEQLDLAALADEGWISTTTLAQ